MTVYKNLQIYKESTSTRKSQMPLFTGGIRDFPRFKMDFEEQVMLTMHLTSQDRYILLNSSPWTTVMDLVHGLLEWTTHGLP